MHICVCVGSEPSQVSFKHTQTFVVAVLVKISLPQRRNSSPMSAEGSEHKTARRV